MREPVDVYVRGKILRDWTSVEIRRSIDTASGSFEITAPGRSPFPMATGDLVELYAGDDLMLRGHADQVARTLAGPITIRGRDMTADLVDCTAADDPAEWTNVDLAQLATEVARPFGVLVEYSAGPKAAFDVFHRRPGDTPWGIIERACRLRGLLVYSDGTGHLVIREPGRDVSDVELVEGDNLQAAEFTVDDSLRFGTYVVQGQRPGSDAASGDLVARVEGRATDAGARASRVLVVVAEANVTTQTAGERAQWEAAVRAANAVRVDATVPDWRKGGALEGPLWTVNELVAVRAPSLDLDRYLLARGVVFTQNERGQHTTIDLCREDAFRPQPDLSADDDPQSEWLRRTAAAGDLPDDVSPEDVDP